MEGEEGNEEDKIAFHFYPIIYRARKEEKRKSERRDSFFLSEINFDGRERGGSEEERGVGCSFSSDCECGRG